MEEGDWDFVLDINLKGTFFCMQVFARSMSCHNIPGLINLASQAISGNSPNGTHYCASKSGIVGLTVATELAPASKCSAPGLTDTAQPRYGHSEEELKAKAETNPLGRMTKPEEIADMAVFYAQIKPLWLPDKFIM